MNIGILYPRSKTHANLGFDFLDGLKSRLKQQLTTHFHLFTESIGFGGMEKEVYEKAEKLLMIEGVDVLIAYADQRVMDILTPLFYASGRLIIIVNPGANYPVNWVPQKNIVSLTLQHGFLCWLAGALAGQSQNPKAAVATTYYDCGYLHMAAITKSLMNAGGTIAFNYVNRQPYDDTFNIDQLADFLSANKHTRNLLCVFDSLPASLFYKKLDQHPDAEDLRLFVSPMMLEKSALEAGPKEFKFSIDGYAPWLVSADNEDNRSFTAFYRQEVKRQATAFSVLGWEAGMVLQEVFSLADNNYEDGSCIAERLKDVTFYSPRGRLRLDDDTHYFRAPAFRCSVKKHYGNMEAEYTDNFDRDWKAFTEDIIEGPTSGWMNTYLCY